jgi:pantothenate kinase
VDVSVPERRVDPRLVDRLRALAADTGPERPRRLLGITGPPGAGKTTLVAALLEAAAADPALAGRVAHVPMDGFHRTNAELDLLGRRDRKGAPDTFDAAAYADVLGQLHALPRGVVAAPAFDHGVGEPEPAAIHVGAAADVVLTEGNYLLLDDPDWAPVRAALDEVWFCALDDAVRRDRLIARHVEAGREPAAATAWVDRSDEANARQVGPTVVGAQLVVVDLQLVDPGPG